MGEKFENFSGENLQGIFRGNVRECLGIWGDFLGKIYQREMYRALFGELSGRSCGGCFWGNVWRWLFWGGYAIRDTQKWSDDYWTRTRTWGNLSVENMYEDVRELSRGNFPGECMGIVQEGLVWAQCYLVGMV